MRRRTKLFKIGTLSVRFSSLIHDFGSVSKLNPHKASKYTSEAS